PRVPLRTGARPAGAVAQRPPAVPAVQGVPVPLAEPRQPRPRPAHAVDRPRLAARQDRGQLAPAAVAAVDEGHAPGPEAALRAVAGGARTGGEAAGPRRPVPRVRRRRPL